MNRPEQRFTPILRSDEGEAGRCESSVVNFSIGGDATNAVPAALAAHLPPAVDCSRAISHERSNARDTPSEVYDLGLMNGADSHSSTFPRGRLRVASAEPASTAGATS